MKCQLVFQLALIFALNYMCYGLEDTAQLTHYESYARCCKNNPDYDPNAPTGECTDFSAW